MDRIEKILQNASKEKIEVPEKFTNCITSTSYKQRKETLSWKYWKAQKKIAVICACAFFISTVAFAGYKLESIFRIQNINDKGIQTAIQNEYIQNIDMSYIEKEEVKFKVDYLLMDDINFDLVFNFVTKDPVELYDAIYLQALKITDEMGNQIYEDSESQEIWSQNKALSGGNWSLIERQDHILRQVLHLSSNEFPKSQKILVEFKAIILYKVEKGNAQGIEYKQNYQLAFDVSEQLRNRQNILYKVEDGCDWVKDVKLTNSGLAMTIQVPEEMDENTFLASAKQMEVQDEKKNKYHIADKMMNIDREKKDYMPRQWVIIFDMTSYQSSQELILQWEEEAIKLTKK